MNKQIQGFMEFIRGQGVIGLAIGLAVGTQVVIVVGSLVDEFIDPIVGYLLSFVLSSEGSLDTYKWVVSTGDHPLTIGWGIIISTLIKLIAIAAVIFYVVKALKLDKLDISKEEKPKKK